VTVKYTDVVTGTRFSPNSSGPSQFDVSTGQTRLFGHNGTVYAGEVGVFVTAGPVLLDVNGVPVALPHHVVSVCEALGTTTNTI